MLTHGRLMNHELFGEIRYDRDDERWTGSATLRRFATFGDETRFDDEAEQERRREGILPLTVCDPKGDGPSPPQEVSFRFLRDHEADVFQATLGALFESYREYTASPMSGFWVWVGRLLGVKPIESPEGLADSAIFTGLEVRPESKNGMAYLLFNVNCDWEPEHGMAVVYHKDQPATWSTIDALEFESDADGE
jgi:hypothetical protein